jgi:hypothetical protein
MKTDIILVHSGNRFPKHINDCISLLNKYNFNIHLILEQKFHNSIKSKNIQLINIENTKDSRYENYTLDNYNSSFRDGFFPRTSSRFILIDNYVKQNNLNSFFHIENDIAIFSDLSKEKESLDSSFYETAIVMDNPIRCVPSIIWYKNYIATSRLSDFIYKNNNLDDMKNLAIYFHKNRSYVTNLPIVPFDLIDKAFSINFGNMYDKIHTIFDGAAIGQYLYGIDNIEENTHSNTKGFVNETCVFDISKYKITLANGNPIFHYANKLVSINNLHIHSKNFTELL